MYFRGQKSRSKVADGVARVSTIERSAGQNHRGEMIDELLRSGNKSKNKYKEHQRQMQKPKSISNDYRWQSQHQSSVSSDDEDLYTARIRYLRQSRRPGQSREHRRPPVLQNYGLGNANFANAELDQKQQRVGQKIIVSYDQDSQQPTPNMKMLVLALVRQQIRQEVMQMSEIAVEQNPFEMDNMRLNSFIANTPDLMDHWKVMMLEESLRIIDESFETNNLGWVAPGLVNNSPADWDKHFPLPIEELTLVLLPPDKPEISRSQVATEYIQAQRRRQGQDSDETSQLYQSDLLKIDVAAAAPNETFERVCNSYKAIVQKVIEIEYIEKRPETCEAVSKYVEQLKISADEVVSDALASDIKDTQKYGSTFLQSLVGRIMIELHGIHAKQNFEPMHLSMTAFRRD